MKIKIACRAVIVRGNNFIVVQEAKGKIRGKWGFPGGSLEDGEDLITTLVREIEQEVGISILTRGLIDVYQYRNSKGENVIAFYFLASTKNKKIKTNDKDEILNIKWISFNDFLNYKDTEIRDLHLKKVIKNYLKNGFTKNRLSVIKQSYVYRK